MMILLMVSSCANCPVCDNSPRVNIPDLPIEWDSRITAIPDTPKLSKAETKKLLLDYEFNERHNRRVIKYLRKNHKDIRAIYGK